MSRPLPQEEIQEAVRLVEDWSPLRGARIFITGGTGFIGKWLLETLGCANLAHGLNAKVVVLSRHPGAFLQAMPHLRDADWLHFQQGDIKGLPILKEAFTHVIHGAASTDAREYTQDPEAMMQVMVEGSRRIAEAISHQPPKRLLYLSSGAVYGPQPTHLSHFPEDYPLPSDLNAAHDAYGQGKRDSERILRSACEELGIPCPIARCFAFAGPYLPMDLHFAFGNFVRDALAGGPIRVEGDGTPLRSFLYASELAAWLYKLLMEGQSTTYHVGSDQSVSIRDLALAIGAIAGVGVKIMGEPNPLVHPSRYVPSVSRIPDTLSLRQTIGLTTAIERTLAWHRGTSSELLLPS